MSCNYKLNKNHTTLPLERVSVDSWFHSPLSLSLSLQTILVGDSGVGKTSLLVQNDRGKFLPGSFTATVGIGFTVSAPLPPSLVVPLTWPERCHCDDLSVLTWQQSQSSHPLRCHWGASWIRACVRACVCVMADADNDDEGDVCDQDGNGRSNERLQNKADFKQRGFHARWRVGRELYSARQAEIRGRKWGGCMDRLVRDMYMFEVEALI